jgi:hypothetical protein
MGFVGPMDTVARNSCDTNNTNPGLRLCFHTGGGNINGGYRCGADLGLNGSVAFERVYYQRNQYRPVGPQNSVPVATVTGGGWTECYRDTYGNAATPSLASIQTQCSGADIMLACRPTGSATLQALAQAPRADVFFDVGNGVNAVHTGNGTDWYFSTGASMGFTQVGTGVNRTSCDTSAGNPATRLCWHTGGGNINPGWRCGGNTGLNGDNGFERIIYHTAPAYRPVGPQMNVPVTTVTNGGWTECLRESYSVNGTPLATLQAQCSRANIMVACRTNGNANLQLLAQAPRADVFFNTGDMNNTLRVANGTGWYYSNSWSLGFVVAGETVNRNSCDTNNTNANTRLCIHTGGNNLNPGWRCGVDTGIGASHERIFYHAN